MDSGGILEGSVYCLAHADRKKWQGGFLSGGVCNIHISHPCSGREAGAA